MYKGNEGQWAFFLHRLSGVAILLYLILHTISISSVLLGPSVYGAVHEVYKLMIFRVGLIGVAGAVAYHSFNGLRIVIMDFTGWGVRRQRELWYGSLFFAAVLMAVTLYYNFPRLVGGGNDMAIKARTLTDARAQAKSNPELAWWVFMRLSGVALVVLTLFHLFNNYILVDEQGWDYEAIASRYADWWNKLYLLALLGLGLMHGANGMRYIIDDATAKNRVARFWVKTTVNTVIAAVFVFGILALVVKIPIPGVDTP